VHLNGDSHKVRLKRKDAPTRVSEFSEDQLYGVSLYLAQVCERAKPNRENLRALSQYQERGGIQAVLQAPATAEIRAYVAILEEIVRK
jgi:hypothetical protein